MPQRRAAADERLHEDRFRHVHRALKESVAPLIVRSLQEQVADLAAPEVPLLTRRGWIPPQPLSLDHIRLLYTPPRKDTFAAARRQLAPYWPRIAGSPVPTYSAAVQRFDGAAHFFDADSFRLLGLEPPAAGCEDRTTTLRFTRGSYFDWYDTGEALGYEAARCYAESGGATVVGRYRRWLNSPFDFVRRCATPGINTLTVRTSRDRTVRSTFYLHRRTDVATARGTVHVVPAGEFQPSGGHVGDRATGGEDFDIRATVIREYAEELLGAADLADPTSKESPVDFMARHAAVESALRGGGARLHYLGTGLYPLTWKPEILLVCVFEDRLFDQTFADMKREVDEGAIEGPGGRPLTEDDRLPGRDRLPGAVSLLLGRKKRPYQGLPFDEATVHSYAEAPTTLPAARACLKLAWKHREFLDIPA
ncbi:hypothetical protein ABZ723_06920 [Streptomyces sp. NPDC006700]|uniref:hypothetical protein n=1 Tax=unclassified Streptomyces TaxID=2593676 RepID=UPI00340F8DA7